jgi:hypothetical protein
VITNELQRILLDMYVWHSVHTSDLFKKQRRDITPSRFFLMDKYLASGAFKKFKTKLVTQRHQQDKGIYENMSSQTVATSSGLAIAAIATTESQGDCNRYRECVPKCTDCTNETQLRHNIDTEKD